MKNSLLTLLLFTIGSSAYAQSAYLDSMKNYRARYVNEHEVITTPETKKGLRFYPIDEQYRVEARFEKVSDGQWFSMETSGSVRKTFRVYGMLHFLVHDTAVSMPVYQSQSIIQLDQYKDHLFLPFTDLSTGESTYEVGRYIDLTTHDIKGDKVIVDFNKAYNPYCAYVSGKYNCPIPPAANRLGVFIGAGEMSFQK